MLGLLRVQIPSLALPLVILLVDLDEVLGRQHGVVVRVVQVLGWELLSLNSNEFRTTIGLKYDKNEAVHCDRLA